jgi:hypothetical protein
MFDKEVEHAPKRIMPTRFWLYTLAVMMNVIGLMHVSLLLFKLSLSIFPWIVVLTYVFVQLVDAVSAPGSGILYDKYGKLILIIPFVFSIFPSMLGLYGGTIALLSGSMIFGMVYGMQESIYRAAVSDIISIDKRGTAYGIFNAVYGFGFLLSGSIYGFFIENGLIPHGIVYTLVIQLFAVILLYLSSKR